ALLANARCLSEGVDVPSLDGVAFIDPRSSQIDIIQAVGRAIRLSASKTAGTIVLPVFIEDGADPVASIEASNFKPIWDVLNALKAHDDVLSAQLDQIRTGLGKRPGSAVGPEALSRIQFDLPASVDASFGEALRTHLVERVTDSWEFSFGALQAYAQEHGDCFLPVSHKLPDGYQLGMWLVNQRARQATIPTERKARLEALQGWSWSPHDAAWETGFQHLSEYAAASGNCNVAQTHVQLDGYRLGQWVANQRAKQLKMTIARQSRLEALPGWHWSPRDAAWEMGYQQLNDYAATSGDCLVRAEHKLANGYQLGMWVATQRLKRSVMSIEKRLRLEALPGWCWDPIDMAWEVGFRHLAEYVAARGDCAVSAKHRPADGYLLRAWVQRQRSNRATISLDRRARLEALEGWIWSPHDTAWETGFQGLSGYAAAHGHCAVPQTHKLADGYQLGTWVGTQRAKQLKLTVERRARLEALPDWSWNSLDALWEVGFQHLSGYAAEHGDCSVSASHKLPGGYQLGRWLRTQRGRQATMSADRKARLEALPGWRWKARDGQ
ncbi:MAG: hypothetical protein B7Y51_07330, partial [Burkholderiales bacterium 28-67-8]